MWATIIQLVLKVFANVSDYFKNRQLLEAGKAEANAERLQGDVDATRKANAAAIDPSNLERVRKKYRRSF